MDWEKVIKGLECLTQMTSCVGCPYWDSGRTREECLSHIGKDAIELLKEQEAVVPKKGKTPEESAFDCGNCGYPLWEDELYCAHCGRAVKWE